tara:strand:- start:228 stop:1007 length:780 start_codon:yes stop_codon:yes gene_type:complete
MPLDQATSLYHQVADTLRRRISDGDYPIGGLLPTALELERSFGVSNITVRKAMALLTQEGLVQGRRGIGTVVTGQPADRRVPIKLTGGFQEWLESADAQEFSIEQRVLDIVETEAPRRVYRGLTLLPAQALWRMRRLRLRHDEAISLHINYGEPDILQPLTAERLEEERSFVACYRRHCRPRMARLEQTVEAVVADVDLAQLLETTFNAPLLFQENTYFAADGRPLAVSHLYFRADRYAYEASIALEAPRTPGKRRRTP